jgi:pyruvate dehydrogenase E2 component (dihydrolipoamide acetyltransferase)
VAELQAARAFTMPKWGIEMLEGTVAQWCVEDGQPFKKGDVLALIETDKISNEVEAEFDGMLVRRLAVVGDTLPVGALLAVLGTGEIITAQEVDAFIARHRGHAPTDSPQDGAEARSEAERAESCNRPGKMSPAARARSSSLGLDPSKIAGSGRNGRISLQDVVRASRSVTTAPERRAPVMIAVAQDDFTAPYAAPRAARLARENGVDLGRVEPTGPRGRISVPDVLKRIEPRADGGGRANSVHVSKMSASRRTIAQRMTLAKSQIPHFYLRMEVKVDALQHLREWARRSTGTAPSVNDYLVRAVALVLCAVPDVNIQVHGDEIHRFPDADVAVAVASERGLITPIVFAAQTKSVAQISAEIKTLAEAARSGTLRPNQFQGGSFTVSNLGMFGIDQFDAIINPPQGAILAAGASRRQPIESDHALSFASLMSLSLACDHRAIDGALGATFMAKLRALIERPESLTE